MMSQQSWRPFLMVSLALCIGTIGTALASPLYPIYQELWHLLPSHITYILWLTCSVVWQPCCF